MTNQSNSLQTNIDLQGSLPLRADQYIAERLNILSRSQLKACQAQLALNGKPAKWSAKVKTGDALTLVWSCASAVFEAQELPLDILYENQDVWVINKASGMAVHPGAGRPGGTLANALAFKLKSLRQEFGESLRPGIVHRLDMETSGVIICAKNARAHAFLAGQFKNRQSRKRYMAVCRNFTAPPSGIIDNYIARSRKNRKLFVCGGEASRGKRAVTGYRELARYGENSLILFKPHTGRTHQLRVHAASLGSPILGDTLYSRAPANLPLMLHAWKLRITLPGEREPRLFCAPVPQRFYAALDLAYRTSGR